MNKIFSRHDDDIALILGKKDLGKFFKEVTPSLESER